MRKLLAAALVLALLLTVAASCGSSNDGDLVEIPLEIPRISVEEVKAKLDAGSNIVIVDPRSRVAYESIRITGAISIPEEETAQRFSELSGYDEVVIYCT
jgi:hypothetical protein